MELKKAILKRRSVRKYKEDLVRDEDVETLLHYAMAGPSACNKRPWKFFVVKNKEKQKLLQEATKFSNIVAPLYIIVCGDNTRMTLGEFWVQDCSAAIENILLGAVDLGLGSCWMGLYPFKTPPVKIKEILETEEIVPMAIIAIGYPNEELEARDQYESGQVFFIN